MGAGTVVRRLQRYERYSRREVHDIFSPHTEFKPQVGTWGLQGIVRIYPHSSDFVFFVTFGQHAVSHTFEESITENGILTWQSQPSQTFRSKVIQELIHHDHLINQIHLFLRTNPRDDYLYLGRLAYVTHDLEREAPVHFKWQILDWELSAETARDLGLELVVENPLLLASNGVRPGLVRRDSPVQQRRNIRGTDTRLFQAKHVDFAESEARNRTIGKEGEKLVMEFERENLIANGRRDLADQVRHVSEIEGDGAGYDVLSFDLNGREKLIEVKTTRGGPGTPFMITPNELFFSETHADLYYLYRIYNFNPESRTGEFFILNGDIRTLLSLTPTQYKAQL